MAISIEYDYHTYVDYKDKEVDERQLVRCEGCKKLIPVDEADNVGSYHYPYWICHGRYYCARRFLNVLVLEYLLPGDTQ